MCKEQYTIGVDYGSLSARGVLVRVRDGEIAAEAEFAYPHGIITGALPDGTPLPGDWFLEHPQDYLDAMSFIVPRLRTQSGKLSLRKTLGPADAGAALRREKVTGGKCGGKDGCDY